MHRALLSAACAAALLASLPAAVAQAPAATPEAPAEAGQNRIQVVNRTGQDATAIHAVRSGRADWGSNTLPRAMPTDKSFTLRTRVEAGCRFDIRLITADGKRATLRDRDVCATPRVEVTAADLRPAPTRPAEGTPNPRAGGSSGTGFVVATDRVLTNQHVVAGCNRIFVRTADGRTLPAVPPARVDESVDLALLAVPGDPGDVVAFRSTPDVRRGEGVIAFGFPLAGLLSSDPKLTRGEMNGMNGLRNNPNHYQISAEVQPGNSGGPLLDMQGHIVGVVVSKLHAQNIAKQTGDIPQNVNFAIKGSAAQVFLRRAGIVPEVAPSSGADRSAADIGEDINRSTVFIRCEK
ncbi:trypsin-like peptidase domain-containing protein [Roseomonas sp. 18066]|uniref:trypsin-like peptidase domain-containing protein n=1 Tax=Roseomonas sp. 18066 TaxID=2681412 RepID=UPI00135AD1EC|nr:trypsin-like peptidase domain-containing protein [Roseomonas sp. 18066]